MWEHHPIFLGMGVKGLVLIHLDCGVAGPNMVNPPFKQSAYVNYAYFFIFDQTYPQLQNPMFLLQIGNANVRPFKPTMPPSLSDIQFMTRRKLQISLALLCLTYVPTYIPSSSGSLTIITKNVSFNKPSNQYFDNTIILRIAESSQYAPNFQILYFHFSQTYLHILVQEFPFSTLSNSHDAILMMFTLVPEGRLNSSQCETGHNTLISSHSKNILPKFDYLFASLFWVSSRKFSLTLARARHMAIINHVPVDRVSYLLCNCNVLFWEVVLVLVPVFSPCCIMSMTRLSFPVDATLPVVLIFYRRTCAKETRPDRKNHFFLCPPAPSILATMDRYPQHPGLISDVTSSQHIPGATPQIHKLLVSKLPPGWRVVTETHHFVSDPSPFFVCLFKPSLEDHSNLFSVFIPPINFISSNSASAGVLTSIRNYVTHRNIPTPPGYVNTFNYTIHPVSHHFFPCNNLSHLQTRLESPIIQSYQHGALTHLFHQLAPPPINQHIRPYFSNSNGYSITHQHSPFQSLPGKASVLPYSLSVSSSQSQLQNSSLLL
ncbi:putative signal peptide protein [Puccinia sorghi]|uniref:Putative signal peptide protein n=1 Tax=Puccinia sorghi TaxID=27349 RepID=A0A0L6UT78_9BASI|nr:putative signal peptide protein [Puccinia sorghi]